MCGSLYFSYAMIFCRLHYRIFLSARRKFIVWLVTVSFFHVKGKEANDTSKLIYTVITDVFRTKIFRQNILETRDK